MDLGAFSISLAVKDLAASRAFYEKLGFAVLDGDQAQGWLIVKNGTTVIGLFEGMFERNMLTFNPGWDADAKAVPAFTDVRELQRRLTRTTSPRSRSTTRWRGRGGGAGSPPRRCGICSRRLRRATGSPT